MRGHRDAVTALRRNIGDVIQLLNLTHEAIICIDAEQKIVLFNQGAEGIFGYAAGEVVGKNLGMLLPDELRERHRGEVEKFKRSGDCARYMAGRAPIKGLRRDGERFAAEASISQFSYGGEKTFTVVLRDISGRNTPVNPECPRADLDILGGPWLDPVVFSDRLTLALARAQRNSAKLALVQIHIDGVPTADPEVAEELMQRLRKQVRDVDALSQVDAAHFTVILEDIFRDDAAVLVTERLRLGLRQPLAVEGETQSVHPAIGVALYPEDAGDTESLVHRSLNALSRARDVGDCVRFYLPAPS